MLDEDVPVWERWMRENGKPDWTYQYDVRVGQGAIPNPRLSKVMQMWHINVTKKRIDVVVHKPNEILIVEVKTLAGLTSIAQVVAYPLLYKAEFNPTLPLVPHLIAEKFCLDVEMLLTILKIDFTLLPPPHTIHSSPVTGLSPTP